MLVERFAMLESVLRRTLWLLLHADPVVAHLFTVQSSAGELIDRSTQILKEAERKGRPRASSELLAALQTAKSVLGRRNDLLHNVQMPGEDFRVETWKYRRGQDDPIVIPAGLTEVRDLWFDCNEVINGLMEHQPRPPFDMPPPYL